MLDHDNGSDGRWELFEKQKDDFEAIEEAEADRPFKIDTSLIRKSEIIRAIRLEE